jgi:hypothetical protein
MPVLTRSQYKSMNNVSSNQGTYVKDSYVKENFESNQKVSKDTTLKTWFVSSVKRYLAEICILNDKKKNYHNKNFEKYRECYYEQLRLITELFYIVQEYFPTLYSEHPDVGFQRLATVMYRKIQELYSDIHHNVVLARNTEEYDNMKVAIGELQAAEKALIPYVDQVQTTNKRRRHVDYTGMDMFEEYDEFDNLVGRWPNEVINDDSDYNPENEEDHLQMLKDEYYDEKFDNYVTYTYPNEPDYEAEEDEEDEENYDEDEDYVEEDENEEEFLEDEEAEEEIFDLIGNKRQNTHIRFIEE